MYRKVPVVKQKLIVDISVCKCCKTVIPISGFVYIICQHSHSFASIHIHLQFAYAGVVTSATFVNVHS